MWVPNETGRGKERFFPHYGVSPTEILVTPLSQLNVQM